MNNKNPIISSFIKVSQPLGAFYIGKMKFGDLLDIAYADVRRIERDEQTGYESYFGIQRKLSNKRINEISQYVSTLDATFPSSILLAIDEYNIDAVNDQVAEEPNIYFDKNNNNLIIKRAENIAHIIDGQHRVFGLKKALDKGGLFAKELLNFELIVTVFVNMDDENQALVFSTINKAHTKVNNSLVYDLYELAKTRSPQRVVHNIVKLLNEKKDSPFENRVKMLGFAEDKSREIITQATLAELIMSYISKNPMLDRDLIKRGEKLPRFKNRDASRYIFRDWFIDEEEVKIAKLVWNYFKAVEERWQTAWGNSDFILTKSTGIIALMRFLKDVINYFGIETKINKEMFLEIFNNVDLDDSVLINENYKSGGVGQSALYKVFVDSLKDNIEVCQKEHRFDKKFASLPESQKFYMAKRRHQCAACAYEQGLKDAREGKDFNFRVEVLNVTQAGVVRHKDPLKGYEKGYNDGLKSNK